MILFTYIFMYLSLLGIRKREKEREKRLYETRTRNPDRGCALHDHATHSNGQIINCRSHPIYDVHRH